MQVLIPDGNPFNLPGEIPSFSINTHFFASWVSHAFCCLFAKLIPNPLIAWYLMEQLLCGVNSRQRLHNLNFEFCRLKSK